MRRRWATSPVPHFRIGVGRNGTAEALAAFEQFLAATPS